MRALAVAALLLIPSAVAWPMFHGSPLHQGAGDDLVADSQLWWTWSTDGQHVDASPVVGDGIVIIADRGGIVTALDVESGREKWRHDLKDAIYSTPAMSLGRVYVATGAGTLVALDSKDGRLLAETSIGPTRAPLTLFEGKVYVGNEDGEMQAFTATGLDLSWTFEVNKVFAESKLDNSTGTPTLQCVKETQHPARPIRTAAAVHNGVVAFGSMNHYVYAVDEQGQPGGTTDLLWTYRTTDIVLATPVIDELGNRLFVAGYDEQVRVLPLRPSGSGLDDCFGFANAPSWVYDVPGPVDASKVHSTPAFDGTRLFFGANNGNVYSVYTDLGGEAWKHETGAPVLSSPVVSNGTVVVGGDDKLVRWLDADTGALLQQYRADAPMKSGAALHDGTAIVVSVTGTVYRFGGEPPARPDLQVEAIEVSGKGVIVRIQNIGSDAPATTVQVWENGTMVTTLDLPALASGETTELFYFTLATGAVTYEAIIDPDEEILEAGRENNRKGEMLFFMEDDGDVNVTAAAPAPSGFLGMAWWLWLIIGVTVAGGGGGGAFWFIRRRRAGDDSEYYAEEEAEPEPVIEPAPAGDLGPIEDLGDDLQLEEIDEAPPEAPPADNLLDEL